MQIQEFFWRILQHCKKGHFSTIWLVCLEKLSDLCENFITNVTLDKEIPLKFVSIRTLDQICLGKVLFLYSNDVWVRSIILGGLCPYFNDIWLYWLVAVCTETRLKWLSLLFRLTVLYRQAGKVWDTSCMALTTMRSSHTANSCLKLDETASLKQHKRMLEKNSLREYFSQFAEAVTL